MDPSILVQKQIRDNAQDLQNFLRDMNSWEDEMKEKENKLKQQSHSSSHADVPPVRSKMRKTEKKNEAKAVEEKPKRIASNDYDSWEKFDVDKACEEVDKSNETTTLESEDELIELERKKQQCLDEKEKGNMFFKEGKYDRAINCYSVGIQYDASNAILFANRAMAYLKKELWSEAEDDCSKAIELDPSYVKAYIRRATAKRNLDNLQEAKNDLLKVLQLDPKNKVAKTDLESIKKKIEETLVTPKFTQTNEASSTKKDAHLLVEPIQKPAHLRSKAPLKRIHIQDVDDFVTQDFPRDVPEKITEKSPILIPRECAVKKSDVTKVSELISCPPLPKNAVQFCLHWKKLQPYPEICYQYLKKLKAEDYPQIFKDAMESDIFSGILQILSTQFILADDSVYGHLLGLSQVRRFSTLVMFMSSKDKTALTSLFAHCEKKKDCSLEEMKGLQLKYEL